MFSIKSAYKSVIVNDTLQASNKWKNVWENVLPLSIKTFIWLVKHTRILTNYERARRHITDETSYPLCEGT